MAAICQQRPALVEIPAPQPKIAARMRRSYLEIISARLAPSSLPRGKNFHAQRARSLDMSLSGLWTERVEQRVEEHRSALSKQQLVQLIRSLILVDQSLEPRMAVSDLKFLHDDLQQKKTNVFRSIPYSRFGSNRDARCYRKAYPHLLAFKVACQEWGRVLLRNKEWDVALEFSLLAWRLTGELPLWDTAGHNALQEQCYGILASHAAAALQHYHPPPSRGRQLLRRFKVAQLQSSSAIGCVEELQRILGCADELSEDAV